MKANIENVAILTGMVLLAIGISKTAEAACDYTQADINAGWGWDAATSQSCAPIPDTHQCAVQVDEALDLTLVVEQALQPATLPDLCSVEELSIPAAVRKYNSHCEDRNVGRDCDTHAGITYCANYTNPSSSNIGGRVSPPTPAPVVTPASTPDRAVTEQPRPVSPINRPLPGRNWSDSYSVGDLCFIESTFDHAIGNVRVNGRTVRQIDALLKQTAGYRPRRAGDPIYNDVQCGNGPANNAGDEDADACPGRVDQGRAGCTTIGPRWVY